MNSEKCNYEAIVKELIENQNDFEIHIKTLVEHCKIELKSWHSDESRTIGKTLCAKDLIFCLAFLYSRTNSNIINNPKLAPLNIFRSIYDKHIKDFIDMDDDKTLKKLRKELSKYSTMEPQLNQKLIDIIIDYHQKWDTLDHKTKVSIYHTFILYIFASHFGPKGLYYDFRL